MLLSISIVLLRERTNSGARYRAPAGADHKG
jgi:hypothetical protein